MLRRKCHVRHTPERIRAGGEDFDWVTAFSFENHRSAARLADPFALESLDKFRPVETFVIEQFLSVGGCLEKPLVQVFANNGRATAFAVTIFALYLLARQGGVTTGAKIDWGELPVSQSILVELVEEPLRPAIVFWVS